MIDDDQIFFQKSGFFLICKTYFLAFFPLLIPHNFPKVFHSFPQFTQSFPQEKTKIKGFNLAIGDSLQ
jgi:hypothetical protein